MSRRAGLAATGRHVHLRIGDYAPQLGVETIHVLIRQRPHVEIGFEGMTLERKPAWMMVGETEVRRME